MLGSDEGIKFGSTDDELLGYTLGVVDGYKLEPDEVTEMGTFDGSSDDSNEGISEGSWIDD